MPKPTDENDLIPILITGTLVIVILIVFLFFFVIIYQRKMIKNQAEVRKLHDEKQTDLLNAVFETQESERKRLAEDLHDSVGQVLSAIKLNLHRLEKKSADKIADPLLADTRRLTDESIQEIRNIIHNVLPPVLTDYGLKEALEGLCLKMQETTSVKVHCKTNLDEIRLRPELELAFYRMAQELFSNAIKHADASIIHLTITKEDGWLVMEFKDNGKGFNMDEVKHGFGLKNLQSRIQLLNGDVKVYTKPQNGTITIIRAMI
ncbi:sensor histidine kinase [Mucilaginibacter sp. L3T2-6]|uniref:sensor histidine kinase n=1 Tax=Mucilaginibacter sp. L3T2-6 TaxID=3062491 RepID=UPI002675BFAB|nr:sensor histidine kinase [Mucilaginibacter sp. L3T2-6]MDO3643813.1 sensor histidine kinase [Mucilaginibacter sp. L3T2-6]MDV6216264.1 sensor histidine kinase [Mucilaginibacter sp. L3T2-6]